MLLDPILLEPEQTELLTAVVEGARNIPREQRQKFLVVETFGGTSIVHPGLPNGSKEVYKGDIEVLIHKGLLLPSYGTGGTIFFDVSPEGFQYYQAMKNQLGQPMQRVEQSVKDFINSDQFRRKYTSAYNKWAQAEAMLWSSDSESQLTTIGHLCREAFQEFAETLITQYQLPNDDSDKSRTISRLRAVINAKKASLGNTWMELLDALLVYWGTVNDLIQRQEHGGQKENQPLIWEDGRRVVFHTAVAMFEVDRSLSKN